VASKPELTHQEDETVRERVTEVRELDGNMKTLVYDNYNKFISATDTIRKVSTR